MARRRNTSGQRPSIKTSSSNGRRGASATTEPPRQAQLLQIAADLFAERGYVATTVRDIADAAGILSGSLYHHFDSKESMIDAILSTFINETLARYDAVIAEDLPPREAFQRLVDASLRSMVSDRPAIVIYQNEARFLAQEPRFSYLGDAHRKFERIWTRVLERGIAEGEFRPDLDPKLVYRLVRDTVWTAPRWWRPGEPATPERIIEQYQAVLVDGIALHH